jgi:hypothetical protein
MPLEFATIKLWTLISGMSVFTHTTSLAAGT